MALIISRTAGLPGFGEAIGKWEPMVLYTLFVEVLFLCTYLVAMAVGKKGDGSG